MTFEKIVNFMAPRENDLQVANLDQIKKGLFRARKTNEAEQTTARPEQGDAEESEEEVQLI